MGRKQSKIYNLYQSLSGYPHAEGAVARTPKSAFDYIRANVLLNTWHQQRRPISCELVERPTYTTGLAQLEADGFTHVVFHQELAHAEAIKASFRQAVPSYADEYVWIFRLDDLRDACTEEQSAYYARSRAYADALQQPSILDERHGIVLVFPPTSQAYDHFLLYLHHFADIDHTLVTLSHDDEASLEIRHSDFQEPYASSQLEQTAALWLFNIPSVADAERTPAFQDWFKGRFHRCQRFPAGERAIVDLYLRADIPCSAMGDSSALDVQYESGLRLHNASYAADGDLLRFYLAWNHKSMNKTSFSLQFFDDRRQ